MEIPKNTKNTAQPYRRDVFEVYKTWRTIPVLLKHQITERVAQQLTDEDAQYGELLKIKNQTEFSEKYDVQMSTLTNWNNLIRKNESLSDMSKWGQNLTKNVLFSLYRRIIQTGDPGAISLWLQVVAGWSPKGKTTKERKHITAQVIMASREVATN